MDPCHVCDEPAPPEDALLLRSGDLELTAVLCTKHRRGLLENALRWLDRVAAQQGGRSPMAGRRLTGGESLDAIRAWAVDEGLPVSRQGAISAAVVSAFRTAHA